MNADKEQPQTAESQPDNRGGNRDIHEDTMNADKESDRDSRQRTDSENEGREGQWGFI